MPLEIGRNDITKMKVDAIINVANELLVGGVSAVAVAMLLTRKKSKA